MSQHADDALDAALNTELDEMILNYQMAREKWSVPSVSDVETELIRSHHSTHHGNLAHSDCPLCREEVGTEDFYDD